MKNDNTNTDKTQALMKSGKAAEFLGVPHRTFNFWVKAGKLIPDFVSEKGYKYFSEENLARFKTKAGNETEQNGTKAGKLGNQNAQTGQTWQCQKETTELVKVDNLIYVVDEAETLIQNAAFVPPNTLYSPKDKVSNMTWNNTIQCNEDRPVVTVKKSEDFGCIVRLNYEKIFADEHVITGANFSDFDRALYDAVVTLMVAGNNIFSNAALWRIITQNPDAKLTDSARLKIAKSMFHIGNFLISIVTDYSKKAHSGFRVRFSDHSLLSKRQGEQYDLDKQNPMQRR